MPLSTKPALQPHHHSLVKNFIKAAQPSFPLQVRDLVEHVLQLVVRYLVLQRRDERLGLLGVLAAEGACFPALDPASVEDTAGRPVYGKWGREMCLGEGRTQLRPLKLG